MPPTSTRCPTNQKTDALHAKTGRQSQPAEHYLRAFFQSGKRLSLPVILTTLMATPLSAQAALPEAIQAALLRADLSASDISIVITPVGDKNASHLPSPIKVIDSGSATETTAAKKTSNTHTNNHHSALTIIEKRTIEKHEQRLHAYTDDPYIYQSLESIPTLIPDSHQSAHQSAHNQSTNKQATLDDSNNGTGNNNTKTNTSPSSIKISFSPLLNHQPDIARTPASTMKLVPTLIALETLGADFVWHTRVYHTGLVIEDTLYGDLVIQGSGDPKMTHERLQQLLYQVQTSGIRHISGDMIVDSAIFHNVTKDPAAFDNAPLRPYNASPDGFLVNFSTIGIKSYPADNGTANLTYTPQLANYQMPSKIDVRPAACGQARYSLAPKWQPNRLVLNTDLPNSCQEHAFYIAYPDAKEFAARVIAAKWQELGNTLSGKVITQETPYDPAKKTKPAQGLSALPMSPLPIVSYVSLNLKQQVHDINHFSNNVMAEQVALSIGAYHQENTPKTDADKSMDDKESHDQTANPKNFSHNASSLYRFGKPPVTDYPAALQTINQWWKNHLDTPPPHLTNGSGLCRDCTITAANLSELLTYAYNQPSFNAYVHSLGVAGVSGTITTHSERLPESAAIGRAWIKTGTLNNVTSVAGYVKGLSGQDYVVVGLINSEHALNTYAARTVLDTMLDWTAKH
ncbi:D-alanyl-D-alanine carboxypeptidase/D-alanyl-D-alanine-endopeptidase [Psychrobacter aquaticus]|uniref:D-alanyl-D-alanine carboxypeptidase n=1 Tax=Psychrobacter aquaticus CMS 56 TaxID=1354303 RepID=U4T623_9GAMM|nr:D-alanyl-D-alanine carboxypeptidase [Psychrobacter aquaticus]ERL56365.1 D-alanyl-D-alanine carboxypeptidase [Psychrobacter aquaticus CMS 56]